MPVTRYIWDPETDACVMETDGDGNTTAVYTQEPKPYGGLISQRRGGVDSYYLQDALGSTRQLINDSAVVTDEYTYSAYGETVASSGTTVNPFRWIGGVGYYADQETGDYYVRARNYSPRQGRWISADPLLFVDGANLHIAYFIPSILDPTGLAVNVCLCTLTSGTVGTGVIGYVSTTRRMLVPPPVNCDDACCPNGRDSSAGGRISCCSGADAGADLNNLFSICDSLQCPGCTRAKCIELMDFLSNSAARTSVFPFWLDRCEAWVLAFQDCMPNLFHLHPCVSSAQVVRQEEDAHLGLTTGHAYYQVVFCDGTEVRFDIGTYGGEDRFYFPPLEINRL